MALKAPAALGVKSRLIGELCPAKIAIGRLGPLNEKYLLEIDTLLTVTEAVPVFDAVTVSFLVVPAVTLPKFRLAPLRDKMPDVC